MEKLVIKPQDITAVFDAIATSKQSREEVADWATVYMQAEDAGRLQYQPSTEEARLWKAILFLAGIDLKSNLKEYLHDEQDFQEYRKRNNF